MSTTDSSPIKETPNGLSDDAGSIKARISPSDVAYVGDIVSGGTILEMFADVETEISLKTFGNEGLCAGYDRIDFVAPVTVGDFVEARGVISRRGNTSIKIDLTLYRLIGVADGGKAIIEQPPAIAAQARATVVPSRG